MYIRNESLSDDIFYLLCWYGIVTPVVISFWFRMLSPVVGMDWYGMVYNGIEWYGMV